MKIIVGAKIHRRQLYLFPSMYSSTLGYFLTYFTYFSFCVGYDRLSLDSYIVNLYTIPIGASNIMQGHIIQKNNSLQGLHQLQFLKIHNV